MQTYRKQPFDQLDIDLDFSPWFPAGDAITTMTASAAQTSGTASPLTIVSVQYLGIQGKVWLAAGADLTEYVVTVRASTAGGRSKEVEFRLRVKDAGAVASE